MENNRRSFFKGLAAFASGVVAAKAATYIPKKEESKETIFVPSVLTITHEGKEYHPLVVEKTENDKMEFQSATTNIGNSLLIQPSKPTLRKANI
jgi:hypothetical protein